VRCPDWAVLAAGAAPAQPVAVLHANRVLAASLAARADGVVLGQRRRDAQRCCPALVVLHRDLARDARAFEPVLHALQSLTPLLEVTGGGVCTFATRGPARYHGGDQALAARATALVRAALDTVAPGAEAIVEAPGVGIADGRFAAALAARVASRQGARPVVVPPGGSAAFLAPLPVATLGLPDRADLLALVDLLARLGLRTLAQVAALPAEDVLARFGPAGRLAHRLARGLDDRSAASRLPPPDLVEQAEFEPPLADAGPAAFTAKRLADHLHEALSGLGLACTQVVVRVETEHGERHERAWRHEAAFHAGAIAERVRWQLEGWARGPSAPTGGIVLLRLTPSEVVTDTGRQLGFWGGHTQADDRALRSLARLAGLLGPDAVVVPEWRGGRDPGATVVTVPAATADLETRAVLPVPGSGPWPGRLPTPSPATVLAERTAVQVLDAAGQVLGVSGRGVVSADPAWLVGPGGRRAVLAWAGPWPVEERWWDPATRRRRARFQLLTDTGSAVLAVVEAGSWWVEGVYD
jgi:protein ImuB